MSIKALTYLLTIKSLAVGFVAYGPAVPYMAYAVLQDHDLLGHA